MDLAQLHNDIHEGALQLIAEHRVQLFAKAKQLCDNETDADELVVRTIDQAIRKIDTYSGKGDILSWMTSILVNLHSHDIRNPVVRGTETVDAVALEEYAGGDWSTDREILRNSDCEALREALKHIDPIFRETVLLRYYEDLSLKEIACFLNKPVGTIGRRLHVALRLLAGKMGADFGKLKKKRGLLILLGILALTAAAAVISVAKVEKVEEVEEVLPAATTCTFSTSITPSTFSTSSTSSTSFAFSTFAYVDVNAPAGRKPPFDSPGRAARTITAAVRSLPRGGCVYLAAGQTIDMRDEDVTAWAAPLLIVGAGDHATVIQASKGCQVLLNASVTCSNVVIRGIVDCDENWGGAVKIAGGHLKDSIVEDFAYQGVECTGGQMTDCIVRNSHQNPRQVKGETYSAVTLNDGLTRFVCTRCVFSNLVNRSLSGAGALTANWTHVRPTLVLDRCRFVNCRGRSGAIRLGYQRKGSVYATNTLFACNESMFVEGSPYCVAIVNAQGEFVNCTFAENRGANTQIVSGGNYDDGRVMNRDVLKFVNTVVSSNTGFADTYQQMYGEGEFDGGPIAASHSLFAEADNGDYTPDNVAGPAEFVRRGATDYLLARKTPGAAAGDAAFWDDDALDLAGLPRVRIRGERRLVDMGCFQWPIWSGLIYFLP